MFVFHPCRHGVNKDIVFPIKFSIVWLSKVILIGFHLSES